jgi:hypothetical protein
LVFSPAEETMTKYLAGVLSVIAAGVLLIAYGLLAPRGAAYADASGFARPMLANERLMFHEANGYVYGDRAAVPYGYAAYAPAPAAAPVYLEPRPVRAAATAQAPRPAARVVDRGPGRDWKKTALVIGGSTATGAGVGAMFGGKKGALIGAAIGGGASTIYESTK